jgi:hypothetical protein
MDYLKRFLINLTILAGFGLIFYITFRGFAELMIQTIWGLFGPLSILTVIVAALPQRRKPGTYLKARNNPGNTAGESTNKMADRRYLNLIITAFTGFGIVCFVGMLMSNPKKFGISSIGIIVLLFLMKVLPEILNKLLDKKGIEVTRARKGADAEIIVDNLFAGLSGQYFIINDINSNFGNIDHVVIKKNTGVFLIETKSHYGKVTTEDKSILINGHSTEKDFIAQTLKNAYWLRDKVFSITGSQVWIYPIIVFTKAFVPYLAPIKGIHIVNIKFLLQTMEKINSNNPVNQKIWEYKEEILKKLKE